MLSWPWGHAHRAGLLMLRECLVWELEATPGRRYLPAGGLEGYRLIGYQLGMGADGLWVHRPAVHMGMVVASLAIPYNLQWLAELHNLR